MNEQPRLVEQELQANPTLNLIAGILYAQWDHEDNIPEGVEHWNNVFLKTLATDYWVNGKHEGDCTSQAHTCCRCLVEDMTDQAKQLMEGYLKTNPAIANEVLTVSTLGRSA